MANAHAVLVLGSGQLGLMMAAEGARLGMRVDRLDLATGHRLLGTSPVAQPVSLETIASEYSLITAELEHIEHSPLVDPIIALPQWQNRQAFEQLPDRQIQKQLFDTLGLATAPWQFINNEGDIDQAKQSLSSQLVLKATKGGYDGKGQWCLFKADSPLPPAEMHGKLIAEAKIDFQREVSVIGSRNLKGETTFLALANNVHVDGILRYSIIDQSINEPLQSQAETMLGTLMNTLDYTGVLAMECFVTDKGLMINEVAPRVHNSGHWSQLGCTHNQFALHLYGLHNMPLPQQSHKATLMLNLIGCEFNPQWLSVSGAQCYWYGKSLRPGRKLGHINILLDDIEHTSTQLLPLLDDEHRELLKQAISSL